MWHFVKAANWWQIKADPSENHRTFTVNGHPFLYTVHKDVGPVVWRFNEDPASGFSLAMYKQWRYKRVYKDMVFFTPYDSSKETGKQITFDLRAYEARLNVSRKPDEFRVFYLNDQPHLIGFERHHSLGFNLSKSAATIIWRIEESPPGSQWPLRLARLSARPLRPLEHFHFVSPFHVDGRPYLFAAKLDNPLRDIAERQCAHAASPQGDSDIPQLPPHRHVRAGRQGVRLRGTHVGLRQYLGDQDQRRARGDLQPDLLWRGGSTAAAYGGGIAAGTDEMSPAN